MSNRPARPLSRLALAHSQLANSQSSRKVLLDATTRLDGLASATTQQQTIHSQGASWGEWKSPSIKQSVNRGPQLLDLSDSLASATTATPGGEWKLTLHKQSVNSGTPRHRRERATCVSPPCSFCTTPVRRWRLSLISKLPDRFCCRRWRRNRSAPSTETTSPAMSAPGHTLRRTSADSTRLWIRTSTPSRDS